MEREKRGGLAKRMRRSVAVPSHRHRIALIDIESACEPLSTSLSLPSIFSTMPCASLAVFFLFYIFYSTSLGLPSSPFLPFSLSVFLLYSLSLLSLPLLSFRISIWGEFHAVIFSRNLRNFSRKKENNLLNGPMRTCHVSAPNELCKGVGLSVGFPLNI